MEPATVLPPEGVRLKSVAHGVEVWEYWKPGTRGASLEMWLITKDPGVPPAVTINFGYKRLDEPSQLATVAAMFEAAGRWLTAAQADDGSQLALPTGDQQ